MFSRKSRDTTFPACGEAAINPPFQQFAIKTPLQSPAAEHWIFERQKTMYGGKLAHAGAVIFIFSNAGRGNSELVARGVLTAVRLEPRQPGKKRQVPRITIGVRRTDSPVTSLARAQIRLHDRWDDGAPETELNFKLYRQATNKLIGITQPAASYLDGYF